MTRLTSGDRRQPCFATCCFPHCAKGDDAPTRADGDQVIDRAILRQLLGRESELWVAVYATHRRRSGAERTIIGSPPDIV